MKKTKVIITKEQLERIQEEIERELAELNAYVELYGDPWDEETRKNWNEKMNDIGRPKDFSSEDTTEK